MVGNWLFLVQILCLASSTSQRIPFSYWWSCARCLISTWLAYIVPTAKLLYRIVLPLIGGGLLMRQPQNQDTHTCICERGCEVLPNTHIHLRCAHASLSGQHPLLLLPLRLLIVNVLGSLIGLSGEHKSNRNRVDAFITACPPFPPRFCQTTRTRSCSQIKVQLAFIFIYLFIYLRIVQGM